MLKTTQWTAFEVLVTQASNKDLFKMLDRVEHEIRLSTTAISEGLEDPGE
jgi:hypothetical protein